MVRLLYDYIRVGKSGVRRLSSAKTKKPFLECVLVIVSTLSSITKNGYVSKKWSLDSSVPNWSCRHVSCMFVQVELSKTWLSKI